jgi:hypothetical protein
MLIEKLKHRSNSYLLAQSKATFKAIKDLPDPVSPTMPIIDPAK